MRIAIVCAACLLAACHGPDGDTHARPQVSVSGEARIEVVPDMVTVRLVVERTDEDLGVASDSVTRRVNAALDAIRAAGVADADLRALGIQVMPVHDWVERQQVFRGHRVSRGVEFRLRDLDEWPALAEALIAARVDRIEEVRPGHSRAEELRRDTLADALADAEARANTLAKAAGAELGKALRINEQERGFAVPRMEAMQMRTADAPVAQWEAGTITITAAVQATYLLEY